MIEILRTSDAVQVSFALAMLRSAGLRPFVADQFIAAAEGSISAFPRRILVPPEEADEARAILDELSREGGAAPAPVDGDAGPDLRTSLARARDRRASDMRSPQGRIGLQPDKAHG